MAIPKKDAERMINLVKEGKKIPAIVKEDFPQYDYWDVYSTVYGAGEKAAIGIKMMITNRLNRLCEANKEERQSIIAELDDLILNLYNNYKSNQKKLAAIRDVLEIG